MLPTPLTGGFVLQLNAQILEPNIHASNPKTEFSQKRYTFSFPKFSPHWNIDN